MNSTVAINSNVEFGNDRPFVLIGGMNVIEGEDVLLRVAERFVDVTSELDIPFVFKASFDKANRSSISSFRGPGLDEGLRILEGVKHRFGVPLLTDVHEPHQAAPAAQVVDIIQVPAFLARQTDLVTAIARTGVAVNIKKPQFLAPQEMQHIFAKCHDVGNERLLLCERGSSFGYNNLIVDMLGMDLMKIYGPVVLDATHALQKPGGRMDRADGRRQQAASLARAGMAVGIAGLFLEAHPDPDRAKCDGPCAFPLEALKPFLQQVQDIDHLVKSFDTLMVR